MFEDAVYYLFLQDAIPGTVHQSQGQEAIAVGVCNLLTKEDYILSTHRPVGHCLAKGMTMREIMAELYGKENGCCKGLGGAMHLGNIDLGIVTSNAIVGANIPISAGIGLGLKLLNNKNVAVCFFGDGASNQGFFHEGINFCSVYKLPVVFICENNLYAASTYYKKTTNIEKISDRAISYGIPGVTGFGNDIDTVMEIAKKAIDRARDGDGPTLIEYRTYRHRGHSRNDACSYRDKAEEEEWGKNDPINIFKKKLIGDNIFLEEKMKKIDIKIEKEINEAVKFAEESNLLDKTRIFEFL